MTNDKKQNEGKGKKDMPYKDNDLVTTTVAGIHIGVTRTAIHNMIEAKLIKARKVYQDDKQGRYVYVIRFGDLKDVTPRTPGDRSTP